MSATNWDVCPRCRQESMQNYQEKLSAAQEAIGAIPDVAKPFIQIVLPEQEALKEELREDYVIGFTAAGMFYVSYKATCQHCGFKYTFKYENGKIIEGKEN